jgi:archaellum biogenesis protein FlaJ (TadC family)
MNNLSREKQIEVIAALCEGVGIRTASRLTGVNRGTVGTLALRVGMGCMELHDRLMVGIRTERAWSLMRRGHSSAKSKRTSRALTRSSHRFARMLWT